MDEQKPLALIVEDNVEQNRIFAVALTEAGYEAIVVTRGDVALQQLAEITPELIILDLHLPAVSGEEVLRAVRDDTRFQQTQVILTTADAQRADYLKRDADLVLLKPVSFTQLRDLSKRLRGGQ
jgi:DNA-binding response OmpR family regulator